MTKSRTKTKEPKQLFKNSSADGRKTELGALRQRKCATFKSGMSQKENKNSNSQATVTKSNSNPQQKSPLKQLRLDSYTPKQKQIVGQSKTQSDDANGLQKVARHFCQNFGPTFCASRICAQKLDKSADAANSESPLKKQTKSVSFAKGAKDRNQAEEKTPMGDVDIPENVAVYIQNHKLLAGNPFAVTLVRLAGDNTRDHGVKQLQHALYGTGEQCPHCEKFICEKYATDHMQQCSSKGYRIQFAKAEDHYFCYIGCGQFSKRESLINHLLMQHQNDKELLTQWGLSYSKLALLAESSPAKDVEGSERQMKPASFANQISSDKDEPVLLQYILSCVDEGQFIETLEVDSTETFYYDGKLIRCWYIDYIRSNKWVLMELAENLRQLRSLRQHMPTLYKYSWFSFYRDGDTVQLVFHQRAKTAIGWLRKGNHRVVQKCFASCLEALKTIHSNGRFHGGVSPGNIACTEDGETLLTVWAYAAPLSKSNQRVRVDEAPYWREHGREPIDDAPVLDLLALLYSYTDLIHYAQAKPLPSEILRKIFCNETDAQWQFFKKNLSFSGTTKLNCLLVKYTEAAEICYDSLYRDLQDLFKPQLFMQTSQFERDLASTTSNTQTEATVALREDLIRNQLLLDDWIIRSRGRDRH